MTTEPDPTHTNGQPGADSPPASPAPPETRPPAPSEQSDPPSVEAPTHADGLEALDPGALRANRMVSCIISGVIALALFIVLVIELIFEWWGLTARIPVWLGALVLIGVLFWLSIVWTRLSHNATVYRVNDEGLEIRRGVLWRRVISVPRSRVQHTDVAQGPLLRRFGLAQLTVHTAATKTPSVALWGLANDRAMAVREELRQTGRDDGV